MTTPSTTWYQLDDESTWKGLYSLLLPKAKGWVYNSGVLVWRGQEYDIAWDIVLTTVERTFEYIKRCMERGIIVHSPSHLSLVIAKNYYRDLKRREQRLLRFSQDVDTTSYDVCSLENLCDPSEEASEKLYEEWLLMCSVKNIATFSKKMRAAILIDLATRMHFGAQPTPLQQAFITLGIYLQEYRRPETTDPRERSNQAALRSFAYKRVAQILCELDPSLVSNTRKKG